MLFRSNTGEHKQPVGLGLHPYWPLTPDVALTARVRDVWMADTRRLPVVGVKVPPRWNFAKPRALAGAFVDHCFAGWDGEAMLAWPDLQVALRADAAFGHLVVASPLSESHFAVEPVSHVNDGFNQLADGRTDTGVRVLGGGEQFGGTVRFALRQPR